MADGRYLLSARGRGRQARRLRKIRAPSVPAETNAHRAELRQIYVLKEWHGQGIAQTLMDWSIAEATGRRCASFTSPAMSHNLRAEAGLRTLRLCPRGPLRLHNQRPRLGHHHVAVAMSGVEVIRAGLRPAGLPHGFLGRRGGVSAGELAGLPSATAAVTIANPSPRPPPARGTGIPPGAELATVHQVHSGRSGDCRASLAARPAPPRRRHGQRPARFARWHPDPGQRAAPARMSHADHRRRYIGEQDRRTIGGENPEQQPGAVADHRVGVRATVLRPWAIGTTASALWTWWTVPSSAPGSASAVAAAVLVDRGARHCCRSRH